MDQEQASTIGASGKPNVDAAITALKADKETKRTKKIMKQIAKEDKKKTKRGKAKLCQGKSASTEVKSTLGLDECDAFEIMISTRTTPQDSRVKTSLDDFLCSIAFARQNLAAKITEEEAMRSKHFLVSLFLELAWSSAVAVNGKMFRIYSTFREECQKVFIAAHERLQIGEDSLDPLQLAKNLMSMVNAPAPWKHCVWLGGLGGLELIMCLVVCCTYWTGSPA